MDLEILQPPTREPSKDPYFNKLVRNYDTRSRRAPCQPTKILTGGISNRIIDNKKTVINSHRMAEEPFGKPRNIDATKKLVNSIRPPPSTRQMVSQKPQFPKKSAEFKVRTTTGSRANSKDKDSGSLATRDSSKLTVDPNNPNGLLSTYAQAHSKHTRTSSKDLEWRQPKHKSMQAQFDTNYLEIYIANLRKKKTGFWELS